METSAVQSLKLALVQSIGLSKDALHIYVGLTVFFATSWAFRKRKDISWPLLAVLLIAVAGELFDMRDDLSSIGYWRWMASLHDIVNTMLWPTVIFVLARLGIVPWR